MTSKMSDWKIQPDLACFKTIQYEAVVGVLLIAFTQVRRLGFLTQSFLSPWIIIPLTSEAIPSATQFFMRAYKISHFPGL